MNKKASKSKAGEFDTLSRYPSNVSFGNFPHSESQVPKGPLVSNDSFGRKFVGPTKEAFEQTSSKLQPSKPVRPTVLRFDNRRAVEAISSQQEADKAEENFVLVPKDRYGRNNYEGMAVRKDCYLHFTELALKALLRKYVAATASR